MKNYARVIDGLAVDVSFDPATQFHPDVASQFVEVPGIVQQGWRWDDDVWSPPLETEEPLQSQTIFRTLLSPLEFKMLFTSQERIAIRMAREYVGDDTNTKKAALVIDDWWSIVDDPRLSVVDLSLDQTQQGLDFLVTSEILTADRRNVIGQGIAE